MREYKIKLSKKDVKVLLEKECDDLDELYRVVDKIADQIEKSEK